MKTFLSKSQFIRGLQCNKLLWLHKYKPELRTPPDISLQAVFDMGTEVGIKAQELFPGGEAIKYEDSSFDEKIEQTQNLIKNGSRTIYEATFRYEGVLVMVDILHKGSNGWEIYEVKGSTSLKEVYLDDLSVQYYVVEGSGLPISTASLVHLNNEYVKYGDINVHDLFRINNLTDKIKEKQGYIIDQLSKIRSMLDDECPDINIGTHCSSPYDCDLINYCWSHIPENSVFDLKERGINKFDYYKKGIVKFSDLDLNKLNPKQKMQVDAELNNTITINIDGIKEFLDILYYPMYFLDFETFMPAIPLYDGTRPFQQIPFQYSLHVLEDSNADLKHFEFLADPDEDPRENIVNKLIKLIPETACIITYNSSFEKSRLVELAEQYQKTASKLLEIRDNIVDLMIPFRRRHYYKKEMKGSYSIKFVLPALVPELSYKGMTISDGSEAMTIYPKLPFIKDKNEVERIKKDLLEYCKLDTLGMVKIVDKLKDICKK